MPRDALAETPPTQRSTNSHNPQRTERTPWIVRGVSYGFIRRGIYWIDRTYEGRRYRFSTACNTATAAALEFSKFEQDPSKYAARAHEGATWEKSSLDFQSYSKLTKRNSDSWLKSQTAYLTRMGEFRIGGRKPFASLESFNARDIHEFQASLSSAGLGPASLNRSLATLKGFMRWARETARTENIADKAVRLVRENKQSELPKDVPESVWRAVVDALYPPDGVKRDGLCTGPRCVREVATRGLCWAHYRQKNRSKRNGKPNEPLLVLEAWGERWRCAALVQLGAGLRYGEVSRLQAVDIRDGAIHVPITKSGKGRLVAPVSEATLEAARRLVVLGGVPSDRGISFNRRLAEAARKAGVPAFTSHQLRHTHATVNLRNGMDLRTTQYRLGHASITTTEKYLWVKAEQASGRNTSPV